MGMPEDAEAYVQRIHERVTYRMHDLSEFMKTLLQRFTRWHNTRTKRSGNLREETFKSVVRTGMKCAKVARELVQLSRGGNVALSNMLRLRVRCFTDGAVIGSRGFVEKVFQKSRERFGPKRKDGARKWRGNGVAAAGLLWSVRDLRKEIG